MERREDDRAEKKNIEGGLVLSWRGRERLGDCYHLLELILVYWFGHCLTLALLSYYHVEFKLLFPFSVICCLFK